MAGQNAGKCFMGLGSEEGAYTLHWQAVLPGGTAWMAQGHWEPSSPTDSTPLPSPFRFFLLPLSPESLLSNYWRAMSTKVVFAKVLLRCEEATLDKEGSGGRVDRSGKDNGRQAMIGSFEIRICARAPPLVCAHTLLSITRGEYLSVHPYMKPW